MNYKFKWIFLLLLFTASKLSAQPCKLEAVLNKSDIRLNPSDPDFRDKCRIDVTAKNTGTCGWEKGKIKLNWQLVESPPKAKSFPSMLLKGSVDVKATVYPAKSGQFNSIDFPWPEYPGLYVFKFWISYNGQDLSREVEVEVNWD